MIIRTVQRTDNPAAYDAAQTAKCDLLRATLKSIIATCASVQELDPSGDMALQLLQVAAHDLARGIRVAQALNANDVFAEVK